MIRGIENAGDLQDWARSPLPSRPFVGPPRDLPGPQVGALDSRVQPQGVMSPQFSRGGALMQAVLPALAGALAGPAGAVAGLMFGVGSAAQRYRLAKDPLAQAQYAQALAEAQAAERAAQFAAANPGALLDPREPADVASFRYYMSLPPEQQAIWDRMNGKQGQNQQARPLTPQQREEFGIPDGVSAVIQPTGQVSILNRPPAPVAPPRYTPPPGFAPVDPSNPMAGLQPIPGGPQDPNATLRPSPQQAAADIAADKDRTEKARAWEAFKISLQGVEKGMAQSETGPIVGRIPAFTSEQQIAEGATATLAPILKQLFRSAGEGVFTDKDQELLMQMAPTRKDLPDARAWKLRQIAAIVAAKMGIPQSEAESLFGTQRPPLEEIFGYE